MLDKCLTDLDAEIDALAQAGSQGREPGQGARAGCQGRVLKDDLLSFPSFGSGYLVACPPESLTVPLAKVVMRAASQ